MENLTQWNTLLHLPNDILLNICSCLPYYNLCNIKTTCKRFNIQNNIKSYLLNEFGRIINGKSSNMVHFVNSSGEVVISGNININNYDDHQSLELYKALYLEKGKILHNKCLLRPDIMDYIVYNTKYKSNWFADYDIVLYLIKNFGGDYLIYASDNLKNNRKIVSTAVKPYNYILRYASKELRNDREFILSLVKKRIVVLEYISKKLQNDREIVLSVVRYKGYELKYASKDLQNDREIVLSAIKNNKHALRFASKELQNDSEIVLITK